MNDRIETIILYHLLYDEDYTRKVLPFIENDYFSATIEHVIFEHIKEFINKYNALPTVEAIVISIEKIKNLSEKDIKNIHEYIKDNLHKKADNQNPEWLFNETEKWCKQQAIRNALSKSIAVVQGENKDVSESEIPDILQKAISIGFDEKIGHDYFDDADARFDYSHSDDDKLSFDIDLLNTIYQGGLKNKTLFVIVAGTNVGKSLALTHFAGSFLKQGKSVLYLTLEMSREDIALRIDANLLNYRMEDLPKINREQFKFALDKIKHKTVGRLKIEEYPTSYGHVGHFRHILQELKLKKNFKPDVIIADYLNIMASCRMKFNTDQYTRIKSIAEELRGLAVEFDVPILTATQTNRQGQTLSDLELDNVSESHGTSVTGDYMLAMISTEELDKMNQVLFKQLKNRYGDKSKYRRFVVGIDRDRMRLYNVEQSAQKDLINEDTDKVEPENDIPTFDKTQFGKALPKSDFSKFKFKKEDDDDDMF